jgi:hypothetical protein
VLLRLVGGDPLLLSHAFGRGRVLLCTTTASLDWTNLPVAGKSLFVPMLQRISLWARGGPAPRYDYLQHEAVAIDTAQALPAGARLDVILPDKSLSAERPAVSGTSAVFTNTTQFGIYEWRASGGGETAAEPARGYFAVNPEPGETRLTAMPRERLRGHLGEQRCFVGSTAAEVTREAADAAAGVNLSELLIIVAIILLVIEAAISNLLRRRPAETIPADLNPRITT